MLPQLERKGVSIPFVSVLRENMGAQSYQEFLMKETPELKAPQLPIVMANKDDFKKAGLGSAGLVNFLRPSVWKSISKNKGKMIAGNFVGEYSILGSVVVVGPGDQGILYHHQESRWGDFADTDKVMAAALKIDAAAAAANADAADA